MVGSDKLAMQLTLLVEGAIVSEQMKRHAGAAQHAKQAATILISNYLNPKSELLEIWPSAARK